MRKALSLMLALLLVFGLLSGCSDEEPEETTEAPRPIQTTAPTETEEETQPPETAETYPEAATNTVVLRESDNALRKDYVLIAIDSEAPFVAQGVDLNEAGADTFVQWLMTEDARDITAGFGEAEFGEAVFLIPEDAPSYTDRISKSTGKNAAIHLALDEALADSGLLEELIPVFEEAYSYTLEVTSGNTAASLHSARNGYADLVLVEAGDLVQTLADEGFARAVPGMGRELVPLCAMQYLLCGPTQDPAGVADCLSVTDAFAAIAKGEYTFTSRGDDSPVHKLEQQLWAKNQEFGDWYISAEMEMGPCLVMNDIEGGYILTDKLTWLKYAGANGII